MTAVTELRFFNGFCDFLINFRLLLGAPFACRDLIFVCCKCGQAVEELRHEYFVVVAV
jgi:hypothetical protein